jgi:hypothetical protein
MCEHRELEWGDWVVCALSDNFAQTKVIHLRDVPEATYHAIIILFLLRRLDL